jgi:hypothetical protein
MTDGRDPVDTLMSRLAVVRDEDLATLSDSDAARALFEEVLAAQEPTDISSRPRRSRPHLPAAITGAAAVLVLVAIVGAMLIRSEPAAAGVRFTREAGYIVATVTDPAAASEQLRAAFSEHDLNIDLQLVPVSPSLVGTVVALGDEGTDVIQTLQHGTCVTGGGGCPIGLRIPTDFAGHAEITLGREAEPDEQFMSAADGFGPGEALHCSDLIGATVAEALPELEARGVAAMWRLKDGSDVDPAEVRAYFVTEVIPWAPGEVLMWVAPERVTPSRGYLEAINRGC